MSSTPTTSTIKTIQTASVFLAGAASGASLALSVFVVPRLLESPIAVMLRQWERNLYRGRKILGTIDALSALGFFYLGFSKTLAERPAKLFTVAGCLAAGVVPFTWLVMMPTNKELLRRAQLARELRDDRYAEQLIEPAGGSDSDLAGSKLLVDVWGVLNLGRSALIAAAGLIGAYASVWY